MAEAGDSLDPPWFAVADSCIVDVGVVPAERVGLVGNPPRRRRNNRVAIVAIPRKPLITGTQMPHGFTGAEQDRPRGLEQLLNQEAGAATKNSAGVNTQ